MEDSTAQRTMRYIDEHPHVKWCLSQDLINHTALARRIAKELGKTVPSSNAAITVAAARYGMTLRKGARKETEIIDLLRGSSIETKSRMCVAILPSEIPSAAALDAEASVRARGGTIHAIRGSGHWTVIFEERDAQKLERLTKRAERISKGFALLMVKSPAAIETTPGVCAYLTGLFAQNGVNIREFLSCWTDTVFIIERNDMARAIAFLERLQKP